MIRHYLVMTLRGLRRNGAYSIINIAGLSVGITCSILIFLWVFDELSFDRFLPRADRLYKVQANVTYDGRINTWGSAPLGAYGALKSENSHIVNTAVTDWDGDHLLSVGENRIRKQGNYASEEFLTMFEFPLVKGNAAQALVGPEGIVITESVANALFGDKDPINQLIRVDNLYEQKVTGVLRNLPKNSNFSFECLLPWKLKESNDPNIKNSIANWENYSYPIYVELSDAKDLPATEDAIRGLPDRKLLARGANDQLKHEFFLYPLTKWRLYSRFDNGKIAGGAIEYVRLFIIIAIFILIMACINFMNLATARSERRAKEVGIRKSVGSGKGQLIFQFVGESLMLSLIAFCVALVAAQVLLPAYNGMVQKNLHIQYQSPWFWTCACVLVVFTGVVAGSYPAFYLSAFRPAEVLKGKRQVSKTGVTPRRLLVTLQIGFAIVLIVGTLVVYKQVQFVRNRDMGFDRENLITIRSTKDIAKNYNAIKEQLLSSGAVVAMTKSSSTITNLNSYGFLSWPGKASDSRVLFSDVATEYDYTKTMGIKVLAGRDFSPDFKSDTAALLINKAALDLMGLKDPIGQTLAFPSGVKRTLVGVIENTVMGSPTEAVFPMYVEFVPNWTEAVTLRLAATSDLPEELKKAGDVFRAFSPAYPFEYSFVDLDFQKKFEDLALIGKLANLFAALAIIITGLGLFGLASFTAQQRIKEIGIRKVLGASVPHLVGLIARDFSKLVVIAFLFSAPVAWWSLTKFLEKYVYRIGIPWWIFPLTGLTALLFALLTVSFQAFRAARVNPVDSLKNE